MFVQGDGGGEAPITWKNNALTRSEASMKRVVVRVAQGFEEIEAVAVIDILRRADLDVTVAGVDESPRPRKCQILFTVCNGYLTVRITN